MGSGRNPFGAGAGCGGLAILRPGWSQKFWPSAKIMGRPKLKSPHPQLTTRGPRVGPYSCGRDHATIGYLGPSQATQVACYGGLGAVPPASPQRPDRAAAKGLWGKPILPFPRRRMPSDRALRPWRYCLFLCKFVVYPVMDSWNSSK